jgi:ribonuclease HII
MRSKQLLGKAREELRPITEQEAICFTVPHLESNAINEINIVNASIKAIQENVLKLEPQYIIVDGNVLLFIKTELQVKLKTFIPQTKLKFLALFPHRYCGRKIHKIVLPSVLSKPITTII